MPREVYLAAAASYVEQVRAIPGDAWGGPGLGGWDLRALVGHTCRSLTTVVDYSTRTADAVEVETAAGYFLRALQVSSDQRGAVHERGVEAGRALGERPLDHVERTFSAAQEAVAATPSDRVVMTAMGAMRFEEYLRTRSFELAVHGLDIAAATGVGGEPPDEAVADAVRVAADAAVATGNGKALLLAVTGRGSLPEGFSVV